MHSNHQGIIPKIVATVATTDATNSESGIKVTIPINIAKAQHSHRVSCHSYIIYS